MSKFELSYYSLAIMLLYFTMTSRGQTANLQGSSAMSTHAALNFLDIETNQIIKFSSLHYASANGDTQAIANLIAAGNDVNGLDQLGATPLHRAVQRHQIETIRFLASKGADVDSQWKGKTAWWLTSDISVRATLVDVGVNPNCVDELGRTALHYASGHSLTGSVDYLLSSGADVNVRDRYGDTPLHFIFYFHSKGKDTADTIKMLFEKDADINQRGKGQRTPLHMAYKIVDTTNPDGTNLVQLLLNYGANPDLSDDHSRKPIDWLPLPGMKGIPFLLSFPRP